MRDLIFTLREVDMDVKVGGPIDATQFHVRDMEQRHELISIFQKLFIEDYSRGMGFWYHEKRFIGYHAYDGVFALSYSWRVVL